MQKTGKCMASHLVTRNAQTLVDMMIEKFDKHIQSEHGVNLFENDKARLSGSVFEVRVCQDHNEVVRQLRSRVAFHVFFLTKIKRSVSSWRD